MKFSIKLSTFLLITTAPVIAEELIVLDEITVTAGYTDTVLNETGANVSALEGDELQHATSGLVQTFENVPGVSVSFSGGLGAQTSISVRGLNQNYVAVRVDGMDVTDPTGPQVSYDFGGIIGSGLAQVEFVKGSHSAIFGSEAVGGVVNIKTLVSDRKGSRGKFTAEGGTHDTYSSSLSYERVTDTGSAAVSISRAETAGFSARKTFASTAPSPGEADNEVDPYEGNQARVSLEHNLNDRVKLSFGILKSSEKINYDGDFTPLEDSIDRKNSTYRLGSNFSLGKITHDFSLQNGKFERIYSWGSYEGNRAEVGYKGQTFFGATALSFGGSQSKETYEETIFASQWGPETKNNFDDTKKSVFIEANRNFMENLKISVAARGTQSDDFKTNTSYRLASVYDLSDDVILRALLSNGFRAASLFERYDPNYGGGAFKLEESQTMELGIEKLYQSGAGVRFTLFDTQIENLIEFNKTLNGGWGAYEQKNTTRKSNGVEISGNLKLGEKTSLKGSYTYTSAKNGSITAARVPTNDLGLAFHTEFSEKIDANVQVNYINGYKDEDANQVVFDMPDYTVVNTAANFEISPTLDGYIRVQNLLNSDYETIKNFNNGGRQIFAGIRATF